MLLKNPVKNSLSGIGRKMIVYRNIIITGILCFFLVKLQAQNETIKNTISDTTILLREVEVSSYRTESRIHNIPGSISVLTSFDGGITGGTSLAATINTVPGVTMQTGTYSTSRIVIRGMGSRTPYNTNRIRMYLNDIPLTSSDGISAPEEIDIQNIEKIEIIKGPASALYGSGLGGSINILTPVKKETQGYISQDFESFRTGKTNISGTAISRNVSIWTGIGNIYSGGYRENSFYKKNSFIITPKWEKDRFSVNSTLLLITVNAGIPSSLGRTMFENNPSAAAPNWKAVNGFEKYSRTVAGITLKYKITTGITNTLTFFEKWNRSYEKRPFNNLDDQTISGGFRETASYHTEKTDIIAGAEWIKEQYSWKLDTGILLNRNRENRKQLNLFGIFYYGPTSQINISIAGAMNSVAYTLKDQYAANGDQSGKRNFPLIFSPRFGINYSPDEKIAVYVSAGHGFSLPSPEETLLPEGDVNKEIMPEQGFQYETGMRLNLLKKSLKVEATVYLINLNNLLVTKRITEDIFTGINAGRTRHKGFEFMADWRIFDSKKFPGMFKTAVSYTSSINSFVKFMDEGITYDGNSLPGIPPQVLNIQLRWKAFSFLELLTNFHYTGKQYLNDLNSITYNDYALLNIEVSADFKIKKEGRIRINAGLNNVTNKKYASMFIVNARAFGGSEPRYYYPGMPLNGYAGVEFHF